MAWTAILYVFSVLAVAVLLFTTVFYIIMYSDLEADYVNPIDLCNKLNSFTLPEAIGHGALTLLFLLFGQVIAFLINLPLLLYNVQQYRSGAYLLDATEIFRTLPQHKKVSFFKLGFYVLSFFFYLYRHVIPLLFSVLGKFDGHTDFCVHLPCVCYFCDEQHDHDAHCGYVLTWHLCFLW